jgi:hypothetical protein
LERRSGGKRIKGERDRERERERERESERERMEGEGRSVKYDGELGEKFPLPTDCTPLSFLASLSRQL